MTQDDPDYTYTIKCRETGPDGIERITETEVDGDRIVPSEEAVEVFYSGHERPHYYLPARHFFGYDRKPYDAATEAEAEEVAA